MNSGKMLALAGPLALFAAQPAFAADDMRETSEMKRPSSAFAGLNVRMKLDERKIAVPTARLNLSFAHRGSALSSQGSGSALELGLARNGKANLYISGQRVADIQHRLGIAPVAAGLLAAGAVAVGAAAVSELGSEKHEAVCLGIGICPPMPEPK